MNADETNNRGPETARRDGPELVESRYSPKRRSTPSHTPADEIDVVAEIKLPIPIKALAAMEKSYSGIYGKGKLYMRQQGEHLLFFKYRTQNGKPPRKTREEPKERHAEMHETASATSTRRNLAFNIRPMSMCPDCPAELDNGCCPNCGYNKSAACSPSPASTCSEIIRFQNEQPPNDYNYRCIIVFNDGYETNSDGGSVHDTCVKSKIAYGWRRLSPNVGDLDRYRHGNLTTKEPK